MVGAYHYCTCLMHYAVTSVIACVLTQVFLYTEFIHGVSLFSVKGDRDKKLRCKHDCACIAAVESKVTAIADGK